MESQASVKTEERTEPKTRLDRPFGTGGAWANQPFPAILPRRLHRRYLFQESLRAIGYRSSRCGRAATDLPTVESDRLHRGRAPRF